VGAPGEASSASGINGDQSDNGAPYSGAVYVFRRIGATWTQEAYLKASNTDPGDKFGRSVALSGDTLAVGAPGEASSASGIDGDQSDNGKGNSGAAYVFDLVSATPVALDDTGSTLENTDLMVAAPGVLDNDTGDDLMAVLELGSSDGLVVLNADGSYTYQPDAGFSGTDSFTYRASNGVETSEVATVTITVVADFDGDGIPDTTDPDDDNDGVDDANDAFPTDPTRGVSCEPGFFGAFFCAEAEPGFFVASSGALTATPCPAGSFSAFSGSAICTDASPGFFVSEPAQSEQLECAAGSFSAFSASTACTQASPGSFVPLPGAQSQQSCRVGFFSATTGAAACEPAPIGTYIDQDGATEAQACPAGTTTLAEGSVSVGACVQIESEKPVTLYQHVHFNGNTLAIGEGEVTIQDLRESVGNDTISSIEIAPGYTVIACQHSGFKGRCEVFNTSASDLRMVRFNDTISSLRIKKASLQPVTVYKHINYSGAALTVGEGDVTIQDLRNSVGNDTISSIEIAPGYTVTACQHSGFRGRCTVFKSAVSDLRRIRFNDVISSLRVRKIPVPAVTVYQHVNFRGNALAVGEGRVTIRRDMDRGWRNGNSQPIRQPRPTTPTPAEEVERMQFSNWAIVEGHCPALINRVSAIWLSDGSAGREVSLLRRRLSNASRSAFNAPATGWQTRSVPYPICVATRQQPGLGAPHAD